MSNLKVAICACDNYSDRRRIDCLALHFTKLMSARGLSLSKEHLQRFKDTSRLCDIKLMHFSVDCITEELAECQILYTFIKNYTKTHPSFQYDGPNFVNQDLKFKTSFFQST